MIDTRSVTDPLTAIEGVFYQVGAPLALKQYARLAHQKLADHLSGLGVDMKDAPPLLRLDLRAAGNTPFAPARESDFTAGQEV